MSGAVKLVISGVGGLLVLALLVGVALQAALTELLTGAFSGASTTAQADIPPRYLALYQQAAAAACPGLDWTVLAGVGKVETDHGRSTAPGVTSGQNFAGARGPMQFEPATFALYERPVPPGGLDPPSPYDPVDAVYAAARKLCHDGAATGTATGVRAALTAYNPGAPAYPGDVLTQAARYTATAGATGGSGGYPPERATVPDPTGTGGHVTPRTATLYQALTALGAIREGATCWDPHPQNPDSDHPLGKACDVFFHPADPADVARGWSVARWLVAQHTTYGVHYVIWQGLIWSTEHPAWTVYRSPIYGCPNPANVTGCHYDHIHVSEV